ncbi:MAG TPA: hypothetical protein VJC39_02120 [Candidatus Nanoarchaeia archaeon]|nr:hypothetical protein [Candidatus Nanoarchaeia archaeon]
MAKYWLRRTGAALLSALWLQGACVGSEISSNKYLSKDGLEEIYSDTTSFPDSSTSDWSIDNVIASDITPADNPLADLPDLPYDSTFTDKGPDLIDLDSGEDILEPEVIKYDDHGCNTQEVYFGGNCIPKQYFTCTDSDPATAVIYTKIDLNPADPADDYFAPGVFSTDESLQFFGYVSIGLSDSVKDLGINPENLFQIIGDYCKENILIEQACEENEPKSFGFNCQDIIGLGAECITDLETYFGRCKLDVCPQDDIPGDQHEFPFTINGLKNCYKDLCPETEILDKSLPYDQDGDGIGDSCLPKDLCPTTLAIELTYPYDLDNDGIGDSCSPKDLCPTTLAIEETYPYDLDNDGIGDSCYPEDKCDNLPGIQSSYPFDNDNDGIFTDCIPPGLDDLCVGFDLETYLASYPNSSLYDFGNGTYSVGQCLENNQNQVIHLFCLEELNDDGQLEKIVMGDITTCKYSLPCVGGECLTCYDPDGSNFNLKSVTYYINEAGALLTDPDICLYHPFKDYRLDVVCEDGVTVHLQEACAEGEVCIEEIVNGEVNLVCKPGVEKKCEDLDNGSFEIVSKVKYTPKEGEVTFSAEDFCYNTDFSSTKMDFTCYEDILITITKDCPPGTVCVSDGLTLECQPMPFEPTCMDGDGSNLEVKSDVSGMNIFGLPYKKTDACGPGNNYIIDYVCPSGNIGVEEPGQPSQNLSFCLGDTYCQEISPLLGAKELKCVQKCVDFDPNNDPQVAGVVVDFDGKESFDVCQGKDLHQVDCDSNGQSANVPEVITCPNGCNKGACCGGDGCE